MQEYSWKFPKLFKYSHSLVSNLRDEMILFVTGVSDDVVEECRLAMLNENINISQLMVHAQQVEETGLNSKNREFKRAKSYEEVLPRLGLRFKTSLYSRKGFPTKFFPISLTQKRIGCLTLDTKRKDMVFT